MKLRFAVLPLALGLLAPTAATALTSVGTTAPAPSIVQAVRAPGQSSKQWPGLTSDNWSGYGGVTSGTNKVTYVSATWRVPTVKKKSGYSSTWIGVDGFNNSNLIQVGTEQDALADKSFIYRAWWEILPAAETVITTFTIAPGDLISAVVQNTAGTSWTISITDVTTAKGFSIVQNYAGPGTSAEVIQEAPTSHGVVLPLAKYTPIQFANIKLGLNATAPANLALVFPGEAIAMFSGKKQISTPSLPTGNAFNIAYGAKQPAAP